MEKGTIKIPATTANLGPGFDVLALALDLWNEVKFEFKDPPSKIEITGEGSSILQTSEYNLILRSVKQVYDHFDQSWPSNLHVHSRNDIPIFSGLGSSATAVIAGVLIGNTLLENPLRDYEVLEFCSKIEGHPDNIAAAILGGLTVSLFEQNKLVAFKHQIPNWTVVIILPEIRLSTNEARKAIPRKIIYPDAVYNLGRVSLVVDAIRENDLEKLRFGMRDKLHENYRLAMIPGGEKAIQAARNLGAAATVSGAGPSLIAFATEGHQKIIQEMQEAFSEKDIESRYFLLKTTNLGTELLPG